MLYAASGSALEEAIALAQAGSMGPASEMHSRTVELQCKVESLEADLRCAVHAVRALCLSWTKSVFGPCRFAVGHLTCLLAQCWTLS